MAFAISTFVVVLAVVIAVPVSQLRLVTVIVDDRILEIHWRAMKR